MKSNLKNTGRLSVAALVTGIIVICIGGLYNILWMLIAHFITKYIVDMGRIRY